MNGLRALAVVGLVLTALLVTAQAGAFSTAATDHSVTIAVANDENAYLGIEQSSVMDAGDTRQPVSVVTVTNRFSTAVVLTLTVSSTDGEGGPTLDNATGPETLDAGQSGAVRARVICDNSTAAGAATVGIQATGDGVSVSANRNVSIECV